MGGSKISLTPRHVFFATSAAHNAQPTIDFLMSIIFYSVSVENKHRLMSRLQLHRLNVFTTSTSAQLCNPTSVALLSNNRREQLLSRAQAYVHKVGHNNCPMAQNVESAAWHGMDVFDVELDLRFVPHDVEKCPKATYIFSREIFDAPQKAYS